jgi:hypothetical protein
MVEVGCTLNTPTVHLVCWTVTSGAIVMAMISYKGIIMLSFLTFALLTRKVNFETNNIVIGR